MKTLTIGELIEWLQNIQKTQEAYIPTNVRDIVVHQSESFRTINLITVEDSVEDK